MKLTKRHRLALLVLMLIAIIFTLLAMSIVLAITQASWGTLIVVPAGLALFYLYYRAAREILRS